MTPEHVRQFYVATAIVIGAAILIAMELLWRMRGAPNSRRLPAAVHASLLAFCAASFATAALYWAMPYLRLPNQPFPAALINLIRIRDALVGGGVALDVAGILWMAWPRTKPPAHAKSHGRRAVKPVPVSEVLAMPGGDAQAQGRQPNLHRAVEELP